MEAGDDIVRGADRSLQRAVSPEQAKRMEARIMDYFDRAGVDPERLEVLAQREADILFREPAQDSPEADLDRNRPIFAARAVELRRCAIVLLARFAQHTPTPAQNLSQTIRIFDAYDANTGFLKGVCELDSESDMEKRVVAAISAVMRLVSKFDGVCAGSAVHWYVQHQGNVDSCDVDEQERLILEALAWQVNLPKVDSWISAFAERFNAVTGDDFKESILWVQEFVSFSMAGKMQLLRRSDSSTPPRRLATGLFCFALVIAGLLSPESLRPDDIKAQDWTESCRHLALLADTAVGSPVGDRIAELALREVSLACGRRLEELKDDCAWTLELLIRMAM